MAMSRRAGVPQKDKAQTHYVSKAGAASAAASSSTTTWRNSWQLAASCNPQRPAAEGAHQQATKKPAQIEGRYARSLGPCKQSPLCAGNGSQATTRDSQWRGEKGGGQDAMPWVVHYFGRLTHDRLADRRQTRTLSLFPAASEGHHGSWIIPGASLCAPCTSPICTSSQRRGSSPPPPSLVDAVSR
jgi:hypothetical protein